MNIFNDQGTMTITGSSFSNNSSDVGGGAIASYMGDLTVINSTFSNNSTGDAGGGGIFTEQGSLTVIDSLFSENTTSSRGGGIRSGNNDFVIISDSVFSGNTASNDGGGIASDSPLVITNTTFSTNSTGGSGGAINHPGNSPLTVTDSTFSDNVADTNGGAIYKRGDSTFTVTGSTFSGNTAHADGGAIYNYAYSDLTVHDSTFTNNQALGTQRAKGGAIYTADHSTAVIINSLFSENFTEDYGGAIYNTKSELTVTDSTITNNETHLYGAGIYSSDGKVTVANSTISGNSAISKYVYYNFGGGGICNYNGQLTVTNSTISDNYANNSGGGICHKVTGYGELNEFQYHLLKVTNSTIAGNSGDTIGGGIYSENVLSTPTLQNTIVANNTSADSNSEDLAGDFTGSHNLIGDGTGETGLVDGDNGNQVGTVAAPIDPMLGPLQDNGGPTWTMEPLSGSPAIDAGDNELAVDPEGHSLLTDQRYYLRQFGTVDIGAVESQPMGIPVAYDDALTLDQDSALTFEQSDLLGNDFCNTGSDLGMQLMSQPQHGTLVNNPDGTFTYTPEPGFWGIDTFTYVAINMIFYNSNEAEVVFSVISPESVVVTAAEDVQNGDLSPEDISLSEAIIDLNATRVQFSTDLLDETIFVHENLLLSGVQVVGFGSSRLTLDGSFTTSIPIPNPNGPYFTERIFDVTQGDNVISGLTIQNSRTLDGGAIYNSANLVVEDVVFSNNAAARGGGAIYNLGALTINNSIFASNLAAAFYSYPNYGGGGIYNDNGSVIITDSRFSENNAHESPGGAIASFGENGTVDLSGVDIINNQSDEGGGIYNLSGTLTITRAYIDDNTANKSGGGIFSSSGTLAITRTEMATNSAGESGGAIYCEDTATTINSDFVDNFAVQDGGAIYSNGMLMVTNSSFHRNTAGLGGGIANEGGDCTITDSSAFYNSAEYGGGIRNNDGTMTIVDSKIINNWAYVGGGVENHQGTLTVTNTLITGNEAIDSSAFGGEGGGIENNEGTLTVVNSTIISNTAPGGCGIHNVSNATAIIHNSILANENNDNDIASDSGSTVTGSHNLIGDGTGQSGLVDGVDGNMVGTTAAPIDPMLKESGYPLASSPVIDAGSNALVPSGVITDLAGNYRRHNGTVDIGAYEYDSIPLIAGDANGDQAVDASDATILAGNWQASPATWTMGDFNHDGKVDASDATILAGNWQTETSSSTVAVSGVTIPGTLLVDADAPSGGNGFSWATAYDDLQDALAQAAAFNTDGDTTNDVTQIWIAEGTYYPSTELEPGDARSASFSLVDGVALYGGFTGTETTTEERDLETHVTTLSGDLGVIDDTADNAYTVVYCGAGIEEAVIDGLTITAGNADGVYDSSHPERIRGAGIYNNGVLVVNNSMLTNNLASNRGGGIYSDSNITILNSILVENSAVTGGGLYNSSEMVITNSTITGNMADNAGGIYTTNDTLTINNSIVSQNIGGELDGKNVLPMPSSLIGINPQFVDPVNGDYRLQATSPAINYGNNDLAVDQNGNPLAVDADGNARIHDTTVDCGAFEFQGTIAPGREAPSLIVTTNSDDFDLYDGQITLREAIFYADPNTPGTTITFDALLDGSTITLSGASLLIDKPVTIDASSLSALTVDANGQSRVFTIVAGNESEVALANLGITGGSASSGGGIYNDSHLTISDSIFTNNSSGAIYNNDGILTVTDSIFSNNTGDIGGAISSNNILVVVDSMFSNNSAGSAGGAIANLGGILTVTGSTFADNDAGIGGGGIVASPSSVTTITNSTFSGNEAGQIGGGGIYNQESELTITNSTLFGNISFGTGGGIYNNRGSLTINNSIIAGNTSNYGSLDITSSSMTGAHNLIGNGDGQSLINGVDGNIVGTTEEPIDPMLGPLQDNGGPTLTMEPLPGSPALDAGNADFAFDPEGFPLLLDQRGLPRYLGTLDIGAVESQPPGVPIAHSDSFVVEQNNSFGFDASDLLENDESATGDPLAVQIVARPKHGTLATHPDGTFTYTPAVGYWGTDTFSYQAVNGTLASNVTEVYLAVVTPQTAVVTTAEDEQDGNLADDDISLREALYDLGASQILFSGDLAYRTISLNSSLSLMDVHIIGLGSSLLAIDGNDQVGIFEVTTGESTIADLKLAHGKAQDGGAIHSLANLNVTNVMFDSNSATKDGGAIYHETGNLSVMDSTFLYNTAGTGYVPGGGGGIVTAGNAVANVVNSTFLYNTADIAGGIGGGYTDLTITNSTFFKNQAGNGAGIYYNESNVVINNTIISYNYGGSDISGSSSAIITGSYNLIGPGSSVFIDGVDGNLVGYDPMLDENGYPLDGSPVIDAGDNALVPSGVITDLAGNYRRHNGTVDIGAYEYDSIPLIAGDANGDQAVDASDATILAGNWQASPATWTMGDFNHDGKVDASDATILAGNWQAGASSNIVAVSGVMEEPEPEQEQTIRFERPSVAEVATVAARPAVAHRAYRMPGTQSVDAVFAEESWSEADQIAISKELVGGSAKKSTDANDAVFALKLDLYADPE
ncbi:MAG: choice-of-anchor Q domain-containing protein [Planctomycetia bacterium]|jgi:predicted outer membrane repeat protein